MTHGCEGITDGLSIEAAYILGLVHAILYGTGDKTRQSAGWLVQASALYPFAFESECERGGEIMGLTYDGIMQALLELHVRGHIVLYKPTTDPNVYDHEIWRPDAFQGRLYDQRDKSDD